jgi:hypothetical protein
MVRPVHRFLVFMVFLMILSTGCRPDPLKVDVSGIEIQVEVERFDRELFGIDQDTLDRAIGALYSRYGDFFDIFNVHIINIGQASARRYPTYLSMFINDPTNREVYEYTEEVFPDLGPVNDVLNDGFRHYLYHYPDSSLPRIVGYVSRFNQGLFTVDRTIGIGLDQYLGRDCRYYEFMGTPRYLTIGKIPERIPVDAMYAWATQIYPYNDSVDHVLSRMIHQGMLAYFVDAMFPEMEDTLKMGFTEGQLRWCLNNEKHMWTHLVEEKLLFSSDPLVIRKLIENAPHTSYYTVESPGRAAVWQGWQIVKAFAQRHPRLTLPQIMDRRDYQEMLRSSRYNP